MDHYPNIHSAHSTLSVPIFMGSCTLIMLMGTANLSWFLYNSYWLHKWVEKLHHLKLFFLCQAFCWFAAGCLPTKLITLTNGECHDNIVAISLTLSLYCENIITLVASWWTLPPFCKFPLGEKVVWTVRTRWGLAIFEMIQNHFFKSSQLWMAVEERMADIVGVHLWQQYSRINDAFAIQTVHFFQVAPKPSQQIRKISTISDLTLASQWWPLKKLA